MSTISLLGCSTSVALATGPTDNEEEEFCIHLNEAELMNVGSETLNLVTHKIKPFGKGRINSPKATGDN